MVDLRRRLSGIGITGPYLKNVILPEWWDDSAAQSESGYLEALSYVRQATGHSLTSLKDAALELQPVVQRQVRYKRVVGKTQTELELATAMALRVAEQVAHAMREAPAYAGMPDLAELRNHLLERNSGTAAWVTFAALLKETWQRGIAVVFVDQMPAKAKRPDAFATVIKGRPVIVIFRQVKAPSWMAFLLAHELGHIARGHVSDGEVFVDGKLEALQILEGNENAITLIGEIFNESLPWENLPLERQQWLRRVTRCDGD